MLTILFLGGLFESGARLAFAFKYQIAQTGRSKLVDVARVNEGLDLDEYEIPDKKYLGHWRLRPGISMTLEQFIEAKKSSGRVLAVELLRSRASKLGIKNDEVIFRINKDGFKGPEIEDNNYRIRILAIGDSCTFGTSFDKYSYPRTLERELQSLGHSVEVVNGGVEGYSPRNVLFRIDEFKALKPKITTIYIGWNSLYAERELVGGLEKYLASIKLFKIAYRKLYSAVVGSQKTALEEYSKRKNTDKNSSEVINLEGYVPSFMADVEEIVKQMQSVGSKVVFADAAWSLYDGERT